MVGSIATSLGGEALGLRAWVAGWVAAVGGVRSTVKIFATAWRTLLLGPIVLVTAGYARGSCSELDGCRTGDGMPYASAAMMVTVVLVIVQICFVTAIWRTPKAR
jgi:hypothetical protein